LPLQRLAAKHRVAALLVSHLRKGEGSALHKTMGSLAFVAAARASFAVVKDRDDQTGRRRLFLPVKNNLAPDVDGLAFSIVKWSTPNRKSALLWESGVVRRTADEAMRPSKPDREPSELDDAKAWLRAALAKGPKPVRELLKDALADGLTKRTVERAKAVTRVILQHCAVVDDILVEYDDESSLVISCKSTIDGIGPNSAFGRAFISIVKQFAVCKQNKAKTETVASLQSLSTRIPPWRSAAVRWFGCGQ